MRALLLFLLSLASVSAQEAPLSKGFEHFYNLEYDESIAEFSREAAAHPDDPQKYNHLAQAVLYRELLRGGLLDSEVVSGSNPFLRRPKITLRPEDEKRFDDAIGRAMQLADKRITATPKDTQALYALGIAYGLRANFNFLIRKAWFDTMKDATSARRLCNRVVEIDPSFVDARLVQGIHDYVIGSLPFRYKLIGFLAGYRGDRDAGIRTVHFVAEKGRAARFEAQVLLSVVYRRERKPEQAAPLLEGLVRRFPRNYLFRFELAQMHNERGDYTQSMAVVAQIEELKRTAAPGFARLALERIQYAKGSLQFWRDDLDAALDNLRRATSGAAALDVQTSAMAWLRLAQTYDLKGQRPQAVAGYRKAIEIAPELDAARESKRYLETPYRRKRTADEAITLRPGRR